MEYKLKNSKDSGKYLLEKYCIHGNINIWKSKVKDLFNIYGEEIFKLKYLICDQCKDEFLHNYSPAEKDFLESRNILKNIPNKESHIRIYYPKVYICILKHSDETKSFYEKLYLFKEDIKVRICKNCGNEIKRFNRKTRKDCCSGKCSIELLKKKGHYSKVKKEYHRKNVLKNNAEKYPLLNFNIESGGIIKNYCKHGDLKINYKNIKTLYNIHGAKLNNPVYLCNQCKEEIINPEKFTGNEMKLYHSESPQTRTEIHIKNTYPYIWKHISSFPGSSWEEKKYLFESDLGPPKCYHKGCKKYATFNKSQLKYNLSCEDHKYNIGISTGELELNDFLESINVSFIKSNRTILNGKEIDAYIPTNKIGLEFNGLYWHSDEFLDKKYHYNKWELAKNNGFQLINIWEDDWHFKKDIIKSIILNKLKLSKTKIYGRNTIIKKVNYKDTKIFLKKNHLQGSCPSSINLGLYYEGELISLMTFGKKRKILNSKSNEGEYELLRFANKLDTSVVGGASKLFKYFLKIYHPSKIISYANCDISNGNLYKILGFEEEGHTGLNYWWAKDGIKFHRSKFMKHKLIKEGENPNLSESEIMKKRGYYRIYGTGNLRWIYKVPMLC